MILMRPPKGGRFVLVGGEKEEEEKPRSFTEGCPADSFTE